MSAKNNLKSTPKNTLFNYFNKSPQVSSQSPSSAQKTVKTDPVTSKKLEFSKRNESDSDCEEISQPQKKRKRITILNDSSGDENEDSNRMDTSASEASKTPKAKRSLPNYEYKKSESKDPLTPKRAKTADPDFDPETTSKSLNVSSVATTAYVDKPVAWSHHRYEFLKPEKIRDINKRRPNEPDYDSRTLFVPESFLKDLTPAMRQWWILKSQHYDCVLCFKVGKFYEFYHMDAEIGVQELGFTFMKGEFAHSGFPEQAYDKMASLLVDKGYKVARVEQTENPEMMNERCKREKTFSKFDKVMKREICQITNRGTKVYGQQCQMTPNFDPDFMMAITEEKKGTCSRYGVAFVDTSIGDFTLGEFQDDNQCSKLLTLLSHYYPVLVLHERSGIAVHTQKILKINLANILKEPLSNEKQFWNAEKALKFLSENYYNKQDDWPEAIKSLQEDGDPLTPKKDCSLALKALGGCLWYLKNNLLDQQVLSLANFKLYVPPDEYSTPSSEKSKKKSAKKYMVLDNITLNNLRVTGNENSLFTLLDHCCTKFGKRLLHQWLCSPSCELDVIKARQEAVNELFENTELLQEVRLLLGALPDLERHLAQIHAFGNKELSKNHPDSRAILYELNTYSKKKISDFAAILNGFEALGKLPDLFSNCSSTLLKHLTQLAPNGSFVDMQEKIDFFKSAFDIKEALKTGFVIPEQGVDSDFDEVMESIEEIEQELKVYLKEQEKFFGCSLSYFGSDRKRYQIEVPEKYTKKANSRYSLESTKKGKVPAKRYHTDETKEFLSRMTQAETQKKAVLGDITRKIFEKFSLDYNDWKNLVNLAAILDVLVSLAEYARNQNDTCVPEILEMSENPLFVLENGVHPLMAHLTDFIPNGVELPKDQAHLELITSANMGGKSTLMRQVGLLAIMTQLGARIPAESLKMTIVDRIFTRLGANDNIMAGQSTFLVELNETAAILKHATQNSLVLLDELGRGTSTYDGTAIATAVVNYLANVKCLTLFSTHYHNLVDSFFGDSRISLGHMACMVENEDSEDVTQENVLFLYKYMEGACPKSYGFNAAKLAGMSLDIIRRGHEISRKVESEALERRIVSKLVQKAGNGEIQNLIEKFKSCFVKKQVSAN